MNNYLGWRLASMTFKSVACSTHCHPVCDNKTPVLTSVGAKQSICCQQETKGMSFTALKVLPRCPDRKVILQRAHSKCRSNSQECT